MLIKILDQISSKHRTIILLVIDMLLTGWTLAFSFLLRFPAELAISYLNTFWWVIPLNMVLRLGTFQNYGIYTLMWRYASIRELMAVIKSISLSSVFILGILFLTNRFTFPTSILIIDWALTIIFVGGVRVILRLIREYHKNSRQNDMESSQIRILIVGAGDAGEMLAREILRNPSLNYFVEGFIDDSASKIGQNIHQIEVLGTTKDIPEIAIRRKIQEVFVAIPSAPGKKIRRIMQICETSRLKCKISPGLYDIIGGKVSVSQLREIRIEDLLGRDVVETDLSSISRYLNEKVVLVTGAGGSIGSELCRQILQFHPQKIILLDLSEGNIFEIHNELREKYPQEVIVPLVGDVKNKQRLNQIFDEHFPQIVFHAAAYKHVPLMEENIEAVIQNNIRGTRNIIEISHDKKCEKFVLISTDKAVNTVNCMGASKRLGEILMQIQAETSQTQYAAVRFGNVLGSSGSVIPLFRKQIAKGGPVTITHPDITRYFMTIPEAVRLVIQAGGFCKGGEIFILDMGDPIKIVNLAKDMIHLSGYKAGQDIEIKFIGLRPGEKLYEELFFSKEDLQATQHKKIFITHAHRFHKEQICKAIDELIENCYKNDKKINRACLFNIINSASPKESIPV